MDLTAGATWTRSNLQPWAEGLVIPSPRWLHLRGVVAPAGEVVVTDPLTSPAAAAPRSQPPHVRAATAPTSPAALPDT